MQKLFTRWMSDISCLEISPPGKEFCSTWCSFQRNHFLVLSIYQRHLLAYSVTNFEILRERKSTGAQQNPANSAFLLLSAVLYVPNPPVIFETRCTFLNDYSIYQMLYVFSKSERNSTECFL